MSKLSPNRLRVIRDVLQAGIELAIVRNNLEMEGGKVPAPSDAKRMARDAVNALQGIDSCDDQPVAEWNALLHELECCFSKISRPVHKIDRSMHEPKAKSQKPKAEAHA